MEARPSDKRRRGELARILRGTALLWIVASVAVSICAATYMCREAALGLDRVVALSDARKTARQTLVSLLDQEAALRFYATTRSAYPLRVYRAAEHRERNYLVPLGISIRRLRVPGTSPAYAAYDKASRSFGAAVSRDLRRRPAPAFRYASNLRECRRQLDALIDAFNTADAKTVIATKVRLSFAGLVSVCLILGLGFAALVTEELRRRASRRRSADLASKTQQLAHANVRLAQTDALQAGKEALEREVARRVEAQSRLAHAAFHDPLTGLPNRALFIEKLAERRMAERDAAANHWAVLFLDLDGFKVVNDSLGHAAGDQLLISVARRLEGCLSSGDVLARLGGDEFTILLDDVDGVSTASTIADRMLREFREHFRVGERDVFVTASIGIATDRDVRDNTPLAPEDVLRNADIAMYRAKQQGKARHEQFSSELHTRVVALLEMQTDFARALERNEFALVYQPIVDLSNGTLSGFEALVRWQHPTRGHVYPDDFIGLAEANGSIVALGEWILFEACRQMRAWRARLPRASKVRVSVNVSAKQLAHPNFMSSVESALERSQLEPDCLNVEITESAIMENTAVARDALVRLRERGVRVHLDDFGTGYSSLAYLHEFPIDTVKIDRSFVSRSGMAVSNPQIVRAVVALARSLDIKVTAEGIETERQLRELRQLGCSYAQGYYLARPLTPEAAAELFFVNTLYYPQVIHLDEHRSPPSFVS